MLFVIYFISFVAVKPIVSVRNRLEDISRGEGDLTQTPEVGSGDEIGDLSISFNEFLNKMKHFIKNIKSATTMTVEVKYIRNLGCNK